MITYSYNKQLDIVIKFTITCSSNRWVVRRFCTCDFGQCCERLKNYRRIICISTCSGISRIRPWGSRRFRSRVAFIQNTKQVKTNQHFILNVAEISHTKVNSNNTMKIYIIETLFTRYLLSELIFLYFIFQTYTPILCNKTVCIVKKRMTTILAVSYTHLDVYKRQVLQS